MKRSLAGFVLVVAGCSEPAAKVEVPSGGSAAVVSAPTPTATKPEQPMMAALALPRSKVELQSELRRRGYELEPSALRNPPPGSQNYKIGNTSAALTILERDGLFVTAMVSMVRTGDKANDDRTMRFLEVFGEIEAELPEQTARESTQQALTDIGREATAPTRFIGYVGPRVIARFVRTADGDVVVLFSPRSELGL